MIPNPFGWSKEYASAELEDLDPEDAAAVRGLPLCWLPLITDYLNR